MKLDEIASKIADNPGIDYSFRRPSDPRGIPVDWRHPTWNDQYRSFWTEGDSWTVWLADLRADDWEFVEPS